MAETEWPMDLEQFGPPRAPGCRWKLWRTSRWRRSR